MSTWVKDAVVIDFESLPIDNRPHYPPAPVGVAIDEPGEKPVYLAWGHINGTNNATWADARKRLGEIYDSGRPLLYHNSKFDVEVSEVHLGLPRLSWDRYHDTLYQLFLDDPRAQSYSLKPAAEQYLGMKQTERDSVEDWLMEHQPVPGRKLSVSKQSDNYVGAFIAYAPPEVVGPYALGDVLRTRKIAEKVYKKLITRRMVEPYDRERQLMPILMDMEAVGLRVDMKRLSSDIERHEKNLEGLSQWLLKRLKASDDLNLDSGPQLAKALVKARLCKEEDLGTTETGKMQTNKEALTGAIKDPQVLAALTYRTQLGTCLKTFMKPWCETALSNNGIIHTTWHSTRTSHHEASVGTRTGRLSSTPNLQNVPNQFKTLFKDHDHKNLPDQPVKLDPMPYVRSYIIPHERGEVLIDRDYSQQELRVLGHFEGGVLKDAYLKDNWLDVHELARKMISQMLNREFDRKPIKNTGFGLIYGMGVGKLADQNSTTVQEAREIKDAYLKIFPGLKDLYQDMKKRAEANEPIRTWGGREYYCEEPAEVNGRMMKFDYKMLNVLIQGSSADITKDAVLRYNATKPKHHKLLLTVHDQLCASVPRGERHQAMEQLRQCMESVVLTVPLLSEGRWSNTNWYELKPYDEKGKRL